MREFARHFPTLLRGFPRWMVASAVGLWTATATASTAQDAFPAAKDRYVVTCRVAPPTETETPAPDRATTPKGGRLILFFVPDTDRWSGVVPAEGPFFERLQPIASIQLGESAADGLLAGGEVVLADGPLLQSFRGPLDELDGNWRVQAVLDRDFTTRGHLGPGNLLSEPVSVELRADMADLVRLELRVAIGSPAPEPTDGIEWIERQSPLLSKHFGRPFVHRAGVVLPYGYHDLAFPRRMWPVVFVIGGFGANHLAAIDAAPGLRAAEARGVVPQAVWVFLDADTPWGHHGFCDSDTNGPVGRALVEEFLPFLEERFRLIREPSARLLTGHSSGGWTALHLMVEYPEVFGGCFASAPDPVDFSHFQRSDLYRDASLFVASDGEETPSYRAPLGPASDRVLMTVRDEIASERAIDPNGRSGEQWAAWEAMWSPYDPARGAPRPLCDPETGAIDPVTVEAWSKHDIARRFDADPDRIGGILATRVRLVVGSRDSYYLNEAVASLAAKLDAWRQARRARGDEAPTGPGFIEILDGLTHDSAYPAAMLRFHQAMTDHLRRHGHGEAPPKPAALQREAASREGGSPD